MVNPRPSETSPFLELPPEMRNRIYRYTLLTDRFVGVSATHLPEPAVLLACKQIRQEASSIYYNENRFLLDMVAFETAPILRWRNKELSVGRFSDCKIMTEAFVPVNMTPNWPNLVTWFKLWRDGKVDISFERPSLGDKEEQRAEGLEGKVIGAMFSMVDEMSRLPWKATERVLKEQHRVLVAIDPRWEWPADAETEEGAR